MFLERKGEANKTRLDRAIQSVAMNEPTVILPRKIKEDEKRGLLVKDNPKFGNPRKKHVTKSDICHLRDIEWILSIGRIVLSSS